MKLDVDLEMGKSEVEKTPSSKSKKEKLLFPTKVFDLNCFPFLLLLYVVFRANPI